MKKAKTTKSYRLSEETINQIEEIRKQLTHNTFIEVNDTQAITYIIDTFYNEIYETLKNTVVKK